MLRFLIGLLVVLLLASTTACRSSARLALPEYGDATRGMAAFVELGCHRCHEVSGAELPQPAELLGERVMLGGEVMRPVSDAYLVTSIIYPSHDRSRHPAKLVQTLGGESGMPEYADNLTVRQMTDIVAFLKSHYTVRVREQHPPYF
jgi:L-cysteine S-thiosulfotransferase